MWSCLVFASPPDFYDWQSQPITVQPGDKIFTSINYVPANNSYTMCVTAAAVAMWCMC